MSSIGAVRRRHRVKPVAGARATDRTSLDACFAPIGSAEADTLILGSLPGRRSLAMQQYYAHPQNSFWRIIGRIFAADGELTYEERAGILNAQGIALWDVLSTAERPGSLDASIVQASASANDFRGFFRAHPGIRRVFFNGRKAEALYQRLVLPALQGEFSDFQYECLPSTSPAHAGMTFASKLAKWRAIKVEKPR